eukprot:GDKI01026922.1.p1 GENE.GDKI01026922.1~~GDKI01026922.1.p1  ORF type:complete len:417 (-),score=111.98 GDKI01026922.1:19-1170(-)
MQRSSLARALALSLSLLFFVWSMVPAYASKLYQVLELSKDAAQSDVKKAFRRLSLQWHPDKYSGADIEMATEKFREIKLAHQILSDKSTREVYDGLGEDADADYITDMAEYYREAKNNGIPELYKHKPYVRVLWQKNIDRLLIKSNDTWVVTFYHPNCGSCQHSVGEVTKAAKQAAAKNIPVKFGVVNCAFNLHQCHRFGVGHFGSFFIFPPGQDGAGGFDMENYNGHVRANDLIKAGQELGKTSVIAINSVNEISERLGRPLTSKVKGAVEAVWVVDYFKPGCPPCYALKNALRKLSVELEGVAKVATINCGENVCPGLPYFPFLQLWVKRVGSNRIEQIPVEYDVQAPHPGVLALKITGAVLKQVVGLQWKERDENKKDEL